MSDYGDFLKSEERRQNRKNITENIIYAHETVEQTMLNKKLSALDRLSGSIDHLAYNISKYKPPVFINIIIDNNTSSDELKKLLESLR